MRFAAVSIKGERAAAARGWCVRADLTLPVGIDEDGAVGSLYKVLSCPQVNFAYPGGVVQSKALLQHAVAGGAAGPGAGVGGRVAARAGGAARAAPARASAPSARGWRAREMEEELPGLRLLVADGALHTPGVAHAAIAADVRQRLSELSNRFRGARAVSIRREPVPAAYRVFFRHIGLEPDVGAHADRGRDHRADAARRLPSREACWRTCC